MTVYLFTEQQRGTKRKLEDAGGEDDDQHHYKFSPLYYITTDYSTRPQLYIANVLSLNHSKIYDVKSQQCAMELLTYLQMLATFTTEIHGNLQFLEVFRETKDIMLFTRSMQTYTLTQ